MSLKSRFAKAILAAHMNAAVGSMGKKKILRLIRAACRFNPTWAKNMSFATQLVEAEHPFYQWAVAMRRDLDPRVFTRLVRNAIVSGMIDRQTDTYEATHGTPPLSNLLFSVTERCNMKCSGCWAAEYDKNEDLPLELMNRVVRELKEMQAHIVTLTGGEPFLRRDIFDLFRAHPDVFFQVFTNGTLITEEVADELKQVANVAPMLSINGFEEENDALRGKGSFRAVNEAFRVLKDRGILFGVSLTATSRNMDTLMDPAFYDYLIAQGAKIGWIFHYIPVGRNPNVDLMVPPKQRRDLGQFVYKLRNSRPLFVVDFWNDGPAVGGCMAGGRHYLHITNTGEVEPCVFCHFAVDNIKNKSLHDVIRSPFFMDIKKGIPYDGNVLRPCMMVDRPVVFRRLYLKHLPKPTHLGAETLVTDLAQPLDKRAAEMQPLLDKVWNDYELPAGLFTFDLRWYKALPAADETYREGAQPNGNTLARTG